MRQRIGVLAAVVVAVWLGYQLAMVQQRADPVPLLPSAQATATKHLALNTEPGDYARLQELGYDVFDVAPDAEALAALPAGGLGMLWVGEFECGAGFGIADAAFEALVDELGDDPKVYGWYLVDEPDPGACPAVVEGIRRRADYIHAHAPGQKAFVSATDYDYAPLRPDNSHLDLIGLDPYPCTAEGQPCDLDLIDRFVEDSGFPAAVVVPVFQTFGQACAEAKTNRLPTAEELRAMLARWQALVPVPALDISYSWGRQAAWACPALVDADGRDGQPDLQAVMKEHNTASTGGPAPDTSCPPGTQPTDPSDPTDPATSPTESAEPAPNGEQTAAARYGWTDLVVDEDFTGPLSPDRWMLYSGPGHNDRGTRTPAALSFADGVMTITGREDGSTEGIASTAMQRYGRWEVRLRLPAGSGAYHPVVLLWPDGELLAEYDFVEVMDPSRQQVEGFLHYGPEDTQLHESLTIDATAWHTYAIEWTPDHVALFADGEEWMRTTDPAAQPPGQMGMTIQLDWFPDDAETTVTEMQIDWARIYRAA